MKELEERYIEERFRLICEDGYDNYNATKEAYRRVFRAEIQSDGQIDR